MSEPIQVVVAHKGAREHYLAARALHRRGALAALVTDWYGPAPSALTRALAACAPAAARALGAAAPDLPRSRVIALRGFGLRSRWRLARAERSGTLLSETAEDDGAFARRLASLRLPAHEALFAYSYAALEAIDAARARGAIAVVDQIDPGRIEYEWVREEAARHPLYADPMGPPPAGYYERAEAEWRAADAVVVNSAWSRDALVRQGADPKKIHILPLAYELSAPAPRRARGGDRPLTALWLGSVIVRKGIPYLVEAARLLAGRPVRFIVAGPLGIRAEAVRAAPPNIEWRGPTPRADAGRLYAEADVFVLPTISDGFAITQVEALAHGVPVIATPNCGAVVEDGRTGFVVPARDARALAAAIGRFLDNPALSASMQEACLEAAARFSVDAYADGLLAVIDSARRARGAAR
jgi:glycosyltransferase involved in cell wall biosynthesis